MTLDSTSAPRTKVECGLCDIPLFLDAASGVLIAVVCCLPHCSAPCKTTCMQLPPHRSVFVGVAPGAVYCHCPCVVDILPVCCVLCVVLCRPARCCLRRSRLPGQPGQPGGTQQQGRCGWIGHWVEPADRTGLGATHTEMLWCGQCEGGVHGGVCRAMAGSASVGGRAAVATRGGVMQHVTSSCAAVPLCVFR